jgi:cell division transport system ATP-binding protein
MPSPLAAAAPLIEFDRVRKDFGRARPVLHDLSFTVGRGELVVLTGASGAGKTTILQLIAGWLDPDGGRVLVAGEAPARLRGAALIALRRAIGIVPQDLRLLAERSVLENVMLPLLAAGVPRKAAAAQALAALARVGLAVGESLPATLPMSARQRTALARAIVGRPAVLLLDEPAAHLDADEAAGLLPLFDEFAGAGMAVVMARRDEPEGLPLAARRLHLVDGALAA